jgi:hypothetical protein
VTGQAVCASIIIVTAIIRSRGMFILGRGI